MPDFRIGRFGGLSDDPPTAGEGAAGARRLSNARLTPPAADGGVGLRSGTGSSRVNRSSLRSSSGDLEIFAGSPGDVGASSGTLLVGVDQGRSGRVTNISLHHDLIDDEAFSPLHSLIDNEYVHEADGGLLAFDFMDGTWSDLSESPATVPDGSFEWYEFDGVDEFDTYPVPDRFSAQGQEALLVVHDGHAYFFGFRDISYGWNTEQTGYTDWELP